MVELIDRIDPRLDETDTVIQIIESCLIMLGGDRSMWTSHEIDPVIDNLLELWQFFNVPN